MMTSSFKEINFLVKNIYHAAMTYDAYRRYGKSKDEIWKKFCELEQAENDAIKLIQELCEENQQLREQLNRFQNGNSEQQGFVPFDF